MSAVSVEPMPIAKPVSLEINKINLVATWTYDADNDICPFCNNNLAMPITNKTNNVNKSNNVIIGICGHGYHKICYDELNDQEKQRCTICDNKFCVKSNNMSQTQSQTITTTSSTVYTYKSTVI